MDHEQDRPENARDRRQRRAEEENEQRAQARERVRVAQERELQERRQRAQTSRTRATDRATAARPAPAKGPVPARLTGPTDAPASSLSVQDVVDLFNHPLAEGEMRRALHTLAADVTWSLVPEEESADRLTCVLVHRPSGTRVDVAQERSLVGIWNSRI